ncbi:hypothetical protein BDK51DRAFT_37152 [Blyttiomyces helicus]|uniref:Uncharacterized protein n=1 Tax=Blyttiomyces helicus TaxID=388810 RepID=A0A4P9WH57_9FUNG|nr:hypothetical protein BDK51DRAFT_37152 [Blyttiomyces helicus]|eukprot:RKO89856.1 hypothetical protein BDK51DRAFT_37152 [Blyttiomyces helicus]
MRRLGVGQRDSSKNTFARDPQSHADVSPRLWVRDNRPPPGGVDQEQVADARGLSGDLDDFLTAIPGIEEALTEGSQTKPNVPDMLDTAVGYAPFPRLSGVDRERYADVDDEGTQGKRFAPSEIRCPTRLPAPSLPSAYRTSTMGPTEESKPAVNRATSLFPDHAVNGQPQTGCVDQEQLADARGAVQRFRRFPDNHSRNGGSFDLTWGIQTKLNFPAANCPFLDVELAAA